jgi:hypothetical protein
MTITLTDPFRLRCLIMAHAALWVFAAVGTSDRSFSRSALRLRCYSAQPVRRLRHCFPASESGKQYIAREDLASAAYISHSVCADPRSIRRKLGPEHRTARIARSCAVGRHQDIVAEPREQCLLAISSAARTQVTRQSHNAIRPLGERWRVIGHLFLFLFLVLLVRECFLITENHVPFSARRNLRQFVN